MKMVYSSTNSENTSLVLPKTIVLVKHKAKLAAMACGQTTSTKRMEGVSCWSAQHSSHISLPSVESVFKLTMFTGILDSL